MKVVDISQVWLPCLSPTLVIGLLALYICWNPQPSEKLKFNCDAAVNMNGMAACGVL